MVLPLEYMQLAINHVNGLGYSIEHREYAGMAHGIEGPALRHALRLMERQLEQQVKLR